MSDVAAPAPTRADIEQLQVLMSAMPQITLEMAHHFADGVYVREMRCPAGSTIVGKVQKRPHFFILAAGEMTLTGDGLPARHVSAPAIIVSAAGVKRAGHAHTDCVCLNIHRTDSTDLEAIELELIEPDETALFDSRNELKTEALS